MFCPMFLPAIPNVLSYIVGTCRLAMNKFMGLFILTSTLDAWVEDVFNFDDGKRRL